MSNCCYYALGYLHLPFSEVISLNFLYICGNTLFFFPFLTEEQQNCLNVHNLLPRFHYFSGKKTRKIGILSSNQIIPIHIYITVTSIIINISWCRKCHNQYHYHHVILGIYLTPWNEIFIVYFMWSALLHHSHLINNYFEQRKSQNLWCSLLLTSP